jgi:Omp85 superfamily domain
MNKYLTWGVILLLFSFTSAQAQSNSDSLKVKKEKKIGILPVPNLGYAPETRLYFGAAALFTLRFWKTDSLTRISSAKAEVNYTINKQLIAETTWNLFTRGNKTAVDGLIGFRKFPENYWGIGGGAPDSVVERVDMTRFEVEARGLRMWKNNIYGGLRLKMQNVFKVVADSGGLLESTMPPGYAGGFSFGAGPAFTVDTRDNPLNAKKGIYFSLSTLGFGKFIGSDFSFSRTELELRKFISIGKKHTLAFQGIALLQTGEPPFRLLGLVGSEREMRGYYQGRYRDQNLFTIQAEYRLPIFWRIGATFFAGSTEVWNWNEPYRLDVFKYTAGAGVRFLMDKTDNINLRLDFALGNHSSGFYVAFGEAF